MVKMGFLDDFFNWLDRKTDRVNSSEISEKIISVQEKAKDKIMQKFTNDPDDAISRKTAHANGELQKQLNTNDAAQQDAEDDREFHQEMVDLDRERHNRRYKKKQAGLLNNISNNLTALNQKLRSLKKTAIGASDKEIINNLIANIQMAMGTIPHVDKSSDEFALIMISIADTIRVK